MSVRDLLVVTNPANWDIPLENVDVVSARAYLNPGNQAKNDYQHSRVFNLCRSYAYQSLGYYVSLLAEARGQRAIPSVATLRDFHSAAIARSMGSEIDDTIQSSLKLCQGSEFCLPIYFSQAIDPAYRKLAGQLYRLFPAPLLQVNFIRQKERWSISKVSPLALNSVPESEREIIRSHAANYFRRRGEARPRKQRFLYDLAILLDPTEAAPPSDPEAIEKFSRAAREMGFFVETISPRDADRITEFDALFIRQTTAVDHVTYKLSRLAHAEGLVVIDDPWSILRSANKIYLAESLSRARLPTPRTEILTREDLREDRLSRLPLPVVLKTPDGAFSRGVIKAETREALQEGAKNLLKDSELILAQEFVPSDFDWRIGVLDHQPLFACKYYMAAGHWQIYNWQAAKARNITGRHETIHVEIAPPTVVDAACRAARLIGDGLYGVDLKQTGDRIVVIEVNDNPNIDSGIEDAALGMELYRRIARSFRRRIEQARG
jgi:glutathione synthase/RimK-type ligase-like ATP-grasp enzyme